MSRSHTQSNSSSTSAGCKRWLGDSSATRPSPRIWSLVGFASVRFSARVDREHEGRFWIAGLRPGKYGVEVEGVGAGRTRLPAIDLTDSTERDLEVPTPR